MYTVFAVCHENPPFNFGCRKYCYFKTGLAHWRFWKQRSPRFMEAVVRQNIIRPDINRFPRVANFGTSNPDNTRTDGVLEKYKPKPNTVVYECQEQNADIYI